MTDKCEYGYFRDEHPKLCRELGHFDNEATNEDDGNDESDDTTYPGEYGHEYRRGRFVNANEATGVYLGERRDV